MSFPDAFSSDMVLGPDQILPTVPRGFGERFDLEWKAARAPDKWLYFESRMTDLWDEALEKLQKATGQTYPNPFRLPAGKRRTHGLFGETLPEGLGAPRRDDVLPDILAAFDQARAGQFDLPDPRRFEDKIRDEATKLRQDAQRSALASYGAGGLGAFLGAASGELSHPVNLATLPIGGAYATGNIARLGLLRFLGRNALIEGGVAMASQTAIEIADAPYQERLATDTGIEDRLERIFIAGAGGAILGLGLSGLVAAARGVRRRLAPTLDEADAIKVAERATLHEGKNPLGPEGGIAHARALETAEAQVAAGRHADVREIVREEVLRQKRAADPPVHERADVSPFTEKLPGDLPQRGLVVTKDVDQNRYTLFADGEKVGFAEIRPESNSVQAIEIAREQRRKGYATHLMRAIEGDLGVDVPPAGIVTPDGKKFFPAYAERKSTIPTPEGAAAVSSLNETASWVIRERATGNVLFETFDRRKVEALNTAKYEAVPILDYLVGFNRAVKEAGGQQPSDSATRAIAAAAPVPPEKAAATAKAEVEIANARAIAETDAEAKAALEAADEEAKMANRIKNCAMGVAIG